jgi:hypothetical protein
MLFFCPSALSTKKYEKTASMALSSAGVFNKNYVASMLALCRRN